jgi:CelD/BcsL family acetyltransferase involved in cellulose biosynthesis
MHVMVVSPNDLGTTEAACWWNFQQAAPQGSAPFMSPTFAQAVDRAKDNVRVAVVEDGDK